MAIPRPFNRNGFYVLETQGTPTVTDTAITFHFLDHPLVNAPYNGDVTVYVTVPPPVGGDGTLPVFFQSGDRPPRAVTKAGGTPLTAADIPSTGYYKLFYDFNRRVLETYASVV